MINYKERAGGVSLRGTRCVTVMCLGWHVINITSKRGAVGYYTLLQRGGIPIVVVEGFYSRVERNALSTHLGFFCRIDTTSNAIVCTTEARGEYPPDSQVYESCSEIRHVDQVSQRLLQLRLLMPLRMSYEVVKKRTEPYTKILEELPEMRRDILELVRRAVTENRNVLVVMARKHVAV